MNIQPGQVWRDRDKRMRSGNRRCRILSIENGRVVMQSIHSTIRPTKVSLKTLEKRWELVRDVEVITR